MSITYLSGDCQKVSIKQLYETLFDLGTNVSGMATILEQMLLSGVVFDLSIEQQEVLWFLCNTLKEARKKTAEVCPDGSTSHFEIMAKED